MTKEDNKQNNTKYILLICTLLCTVIVGTIFTYITYTNWLQAKSKDTLAVSADELQRENSITGEYTNQNSIENIEKLDKNPEETPNTQEINVIPENTPEAIMPEDVKSKADSSIYYAIDIENLYVSDGLKTAYLTFDDGPADVSTPQVLDILGRYSVKATFFVVGKMAAEYPDILRRIKNEGHSIGNHTYSHDYKFVYGSSSTFASEIKKTDSVFTSVLGNDFKTSVFRFPGGSFESYKRIMVPELYNVGYRYVDWNTVNGDAEVNNPTADWLISRVKETSAGKNKIVVLMHDGGNKQETVKALPGIIEYLKEQGYEFKTIK